MSIIASPVIINTSVSGTVTSGTVVIRLYDATTHLPANGNGVAVEYDINLNGVINSYTAYILGQEYPIYTGEIGDSSSFSPFFTKFQAYVNTQKPPLPPPVAGCDLVIHSINIDKPASSAGATDARITVNATSTFHIQYSIDNDTWQVSPTFTNLPGGLITVYCRDTNEPGCLANRSATIPVTANLLISDPSVSLNDHNTSRWNAAFNPIVFTYQRKDFAVTGATADPVSGNAKINVNGDMSPVADAIAANKAAIASAQARGITLLNYKNIYVYLNAAPYTGVFIVTGAEDHALIINTPYSAADAVSGFVNVNLLRPYYKMLTKITYTDPLTSATASITSINRPNNAGIISADISSFLQSILRVKDDSDYSQINFRDSNLSASYTIQYAEQYDDYTPGQTITSPFISITNPYYVTYTARQIQSLYGGNLAQYVPFPAVYPATTTTPAKWISDFAEPVFSNGLPFDLAFIYSEALTGRQLYYKIILLDINRQPLSGDALTSYLLNEDSSWLLNQDASKLIIAQQAFSDTPIVEQLGLNRLMLNFNLADDVYYFTLALYYDDDDSHPVQVMQTQTIRVDHAPAINAMYMRWIGLSGSWNYYRFNYNQEVSLDVQNATIIKNFVHNWAAQDGIEEVISKDAGQKIKLMAEDLSVADIKGLQSIKYSPKVQMMMSASPVKWQTVVLNTATFSEYETLNGQAPFSITFNQPSLNIQSQ